MSQQEKGKLTEGELIAIVYGYTIAKFQDFIHTKWCDDSSKANDMFIELSNIICERLGIADVKHRDLIEGLKDLNVESLFKSACDQLSEEMHKKIRERR